MNFWLILRPKSQHQQKKSPITLCTCFDWVPQCQNIGIQSILHTLEIRLYLRQLPRYRQKPEIIRYDGGYFENDVTQVVHPNLVTVAHAYSYRSRYREQIKSDSNLLWEEDEVGGVERICPADFSYTIHFLSHNYVKSYNDLNIDEIHNSFELITFRLIESKQISGLSKNCLYHKVDW